MSPVEVPSLPCNPTELLPGLVRDKSGRPIARVLHNGQVILHAKKPQLLPVPCLQTPSPLYPIGEAPLLQEFVLPPRTVGDLQIACPP